MFFVYILKSENKNWFYVGLTSKIIERVNTHNRKKVRSTKSHVPLKLIYSKTFTNRVSARDYEKFLKIRSNKEKVLHQLGFMQGK